MAAADAQTDAHVDARVLARLSAVVESRRGGDPDASYTARLFAGGTAGIARKVGEEAVETVVAALVQLGLAGFKPRRTPVEIVQGRLDPDQIIALVGLRCAHGDDTGVQPCEQADHERRDGDEAA